MMLESQKQIVRCIFEGIVSAQEQQEEGENWKQTHLHIHLLLYFFLFQLIWNAYNIWSLMRNLVLNK